jgi:hypothetical protein
MERTEVQAMQMEHLQSNVIRMTQTKQIGERCDVVQVVRNRTQYVEIEQRVQVKNVIQMIQVRHDGEMDVVQVVNRHINQNVEK